MNVTFTSNKDLDKIWLAVGFLMSLAWVAESFKMFETGYNWLALIVFWFLLACVVGLLKG